MWKFPLGPFSQFHSRLNISIYCALKTKTVIQIDDTLKIGSLFITDLWFRVRDNYKLTKWGLKNKHLALYFDLDHSRISNLGVCSKFFSLFHINIVPLDEFWCHFFYLMFNVNKHYATLTSCGLFCHFHFIVYSMNSQRLIRYEFYFNPKQFSSWILINNLFRTSKKLASTWLLLFFVIFKISIRQN